MVSILYRNEPNGQGKPVIKKNSGIELFKEPVGIVYSGAAFDQSQTLKIRSPVFNALQDKR